MSNRMMTPNEAAADFLEAGHKAMAAVFPALKRDSPEYNEAFLKLCSGTIAALFYGV